MTKQNGPTKERELILDILLEILEYGGYSHVVLKKALDKHQYLEKQNRAFTQTTARTLSGGIDHQPQQGYRRTNPATPTRTKWIRHGSLVENETGRKETEYLRKPSLPIPK